MTRSDTGEAVVSNWRIFAFGALIGLSLRIAFKPHPGSEIYIANISYLLTFGCLAVAIYGDRAAKAYRPTREEQGEGM